jgi:hypothetical protein
MGSAKSARSLLPNPDSDQEDGEYQGRTARRIPGNGTANRGTGDRRPPQDDLAELARELGLKSTSPGWHEYSFDQETLRRLTHEVTVVWEGFGILGTTHG